MPDQWGDDRSGPVGGESGSPPRESQAASADAELRGRLILHGLVNNLGPVVAALTGLATVPIVLLP
jgi:hypothetical protein